MSSRRRNYTHKEAQTLLINWLSKHRMNPTTFAAWLDERGITISREYARQMVDGKLTPGPKFKAAFREITGITLVDGLVEDERKVRP